MPRPLIARLLLAAALLAGWQAALEHPLRHVDDSGGFVHLHDGHSHDAGHPDESAPGTLCDALAALTACAPEAAQPALAPGQFEYSAPLRRPHAPRRADAPPFLSQGPPAA